MFSRLLEPSCTIVVLLNSALPLSSLKVAGHHKLVTLVVNQSFDLFIYLRYAKCYPATRRVYNQLRSNSKVQKVIKSGQSEKKKRKKAKGSSAVTVKFFVATNKFHRDSHLNINFIHS